MEATSERGAGEVLLTSMDRDGTGEGYDLELLRTIGEAVRVPVIASGGAGDLDARRERRLFRRLASGDARARHLEVAHLHLHGQHHARRVERDRGG